jgi:hypothetical protein
MKAKNDNLKKHHFWILAGLAPLLVLLAIVFLMTGVSGAIDKKTKEVEDNDKTVGSAKAPGTGMLKDLDAKKETLGKVRGDLWKINWDKQADYFTWPETNDRIFEKYNTMKYGTKHRDFIENPGLSEKLKPAYADAYTKLGASIAPTRMKESWESVLKWVKDWGPLQPESQQLWIVMEDIWMQRALLGPINAVNQSIAALKPVPPLDKPTKRKFVSRIWEMDLEVAPREGSGGGRVLKGKLKNRTGQLQVLGTGSAMRVNVWFDPKATHLPPFEFRIEGSGVAGGESIDIPPLPSHVIPPNIEVLEIAKVEQVLDSRTVPIRRLDRLAIGYLSSKDYGKELKAPTFWVEAAASAVAATTPTMTPDSSGLNSTTEGTSTTGGVATSAGSGIATGRSGGQRLYDVADGSRKRYLEVTDQLRRVPVAFTLVVDQMYVNDVLIAYANSALRFETSQIHWTRFAESLESKPTGGSGSGDPSDPNYGAEYGTATGYAGFGLSMSSSGGTANLMPASRNTSTFGSPGTSGGPATSSGGNPGYGGGGTMMSMGMTGGIPGLGADTLSSVSEAQANAGLVQLTIYGIVTLYERYDEPKPDGSLPTDMPMSLKPDELPMPMKAVEGKPPEAAKPEAAKPEAAKPEAAKPEAAKPEAAKPDATKPDATRPDATKPEAAKPDTPKDPQKSPEKQ